MPIFNEKNLYKHFIIFLIPLIVTSILQNLSNTINLILIGRMLEPEFIAIVAIFFPILLLLLTFIIGISTGTSILVSQAWSSGNTEKLNKIMGASIFTILISSIFIVFFGFIFSKNIITFLGVQEKILDNSILYLKYMLLHCPLLFINIIYTSFLRSIGDSKTPLIFIILTTTLNIITTTLLLTGFWVIPKLGFIAPAISLITTHLIVLIFLAIYLNNINHPLKITVKLLKSIRFDRSLNKVILRLGIPTSIQMLTSSISGLIILSLVNGFGINATTAYIIVYQIISYIQFPVFSISVAASIFTAQAVGTGKFDILEKIKKISLNINIIITGALLITLYTFSKNILTLFIDSPEINDIAQPLLYIALWSILFFGAGMIFSAIMRACGTVFIPMIINIFSVVCIEISCAYWFSSIWSLNGIWIAISFSSLCFFIFQVIYYNFFWKKLKIKALI